MFSKTLPSELLIQIFKYINNDDYKTLYSCILVNRCWHNTNISILWEDPFNCGKSTKILINCLLVEDKNFLVENDIELAFELLERPPLYNYAKFATILNLRKMDLYAINKF